MSDNCGILNLVSVASNVHGVSSRQVTQVTDFSLRKEGLQIWLSESSGVLLDNPSNVSRFGLRFIIQVRRNDNCLVVQIQPEHA